MKPAPLPRFMPLERTVALSDGVFAVVITLLVLGIELPEGGVPIGPELVAERAKLLHQILVYFVAFWVIAMYWSQHSLLFSSLKRTDGVLIPLNLWFLLPVTLLPFVTQLMGAERDHWSPILVFALTNLFAVVVLRRMWKHAVARPELSEGTETAARASRIEFGIRFFIGAMTVGVLLALVEPRLGMACFLLTPFGHFLNFARSALRSERLPDEPGAD